jgi:rfaE bifunctional protein nucleotidyltransferase chain/domain
VGRLASENEIIAERIKWKRSGALVVLVHGTFDLLHPGHVRFLEQARSLGNVLVVAVHSDTKNPSDNPPSVADAKERAKEGSRSITPAAERAEIIAALAAVDFVVEVDPFHIAEFVGRLMPNILGKGAASGKPGLRDEESRAEQFVKAAGGTVAVIPLEPGFSRASLMQRIRQAGA